MALRKGTYRSDRGRIYVIKDPDGCIRYCGQTWATLEFRKYGHLYHAAKGSSGYSNRWIRSLLDQGLEPVFEEVESYDITAASLNEIDDLLDEAEIRWIRLLREHGCRLTNCTDGGSKGTRGRKFELTQAIIEGRISQADKLRGKPRDELIRAKISAGNKGKPKSALHVQHMKESMKFRGPSPLKGIPVGSDRARRSHEARRRNGTPILHKKTDTTVEKIIYAYTTHDSLDEIASKTGLCSDWARKVKAGTLHRQVTKDLTVYIPPKKKGGGKWIGPRSEERRIAASQRMMGNQIQMKKAL